MHKLENPPRAITIYEEKAELDSNMNGGSQFTNIKQNILSVRNSLGYNSYFKKCDN
jgi:hypothetical protein